MSVPSIWPYHMELPPWFLSDHQLTADRYRRIVQIAARTGQARAASRRFGILLSLSAAPERGECRRRTDGLRVEHQVDQSGFS